MGQYLFSLYRIWSGAFHDRNVGGGRASCQISAMETAEEDRDLNAAGAAGEGPGCRSVRSAFRCEIESLGQDVLAALDDISGRSLGDLTLSVPGHVLAGETGVGDLGHLSHQSLADIGAAHISGAAGLFQSFMTM